MIEDHIVEFRGGPLDDFFYGWLTDIEREYPEHFLAVDWVGGPAQYQPSGCYHLSQPDKRHIVYEWQEIGVSYEDWAERNAA